MITKEMSTLVCIDYQEKLIPAMNEKERLVENSVKLINGAKALDVPVILTQQYTKGLGESISEIREAAGTTEYLEKLKYSAYDELAKVLRAPEEAPYVILCGMEAHVCVLQTAIELTENGYEPVLVTDCISSRTPFNMEIALRRAEQEGVLLTTYEAILFELQVRAGNDTAKIIQKIVK